MTVTFSEEGYFTWCKGSWGMFNYTVGNDQLDLNVLGIWENHANKGDVITGQEWTNDSLINTKRIYHCVYRSLPHYTQKAIVQICMLFSRQKSNEINVKCGKRTAKTFGILDRT